jgi:hypothetical protein
LAITKQSVIKVRSNNHNVVNVATQPATSIAEPEPRPEFSIAQALCGILEAIQAQKRDLDTMQKEITKLKTQSANINAPVTPALSPASQESQTTSFEATPVSAM